MSRALHALALGALVAGGLLEPRFGFVYFTGVGMVGALLIGEHLVLARRGLAGLPMAFFTINGVVSCLLGLAGVADILLDAPV